LSTSFSLDAVAFAQRTAYAKGIARPGFQCGTGFSEPPAFPIRFSQFGHSKLHLLSRLHRSRRRGSCCSSPMFPVLTACRSSSRSTAERNVSRKRGPAEPATSLYPLPAQNPRATLRDEGRPECSHGDASNTAERFCSCAHGEQVTSSYPIPVCSGTDLHRKETQGKRQLSQSDAAALAPPSPRTLYFPSPWLEGSLLCAR